jgi:diguanylate cyclase (GGDEF)-like protein
VEKEDTHESFNYEKRVSIYLGIIVVCISIIPLFSYHFVVSRNTNETLIGALSSNLEEKSIIIGNSIDRYYHQRILDIQEISQADVLETDISENITQYITEITQANPSVNNIEVASLDGFIIASASNANEVGKSVYQHYPALKSIITNALRGMQGDVWLSDMTPLDNGEAGIVLLTPITDDSNDTVIKLLIMETNLQGVRNILPEISSSHLAEHHVYILDRNGIVITSTDTDIQTGEVLPDINAAPLLLELIAVQDKNGFLEYKNGERKRVLAGYSDLAEFGRNKALDWSVLAVTPYDEITAPAQDLNKRLLLSLVLIGIFIFIAMYVLSKRVVSLVWNQANYDAVTDLPNRRLFRDRLDQSIARSKRTKALTALLYIDLDQFKEVNDAMGHSAGDALLKEVGSRIDLSLRASDSVARIGGDEFAVILSDLSSRQSIDVISEKIIRAINEPYVIQGETLYPLASIGISVCPDDLEISSDLLKNADQALYQAKTLGMNKFSYFSKAIEDRSQSRRHIANDLHGASLRGEFELYYQPIVDTSTKKVQKAEALIRWNHPRDGLICPSEFIPIAEDTQLINEIGDWVFDTALRQLRHWQKTYDPDFTISINVSPIQFRSKRLIHDWLSKLTKYGVSGGSIVIEITEGILIKDDPAISHQLLDFRDAGIEVAIDDFGTGYSALSYLKEFDIDYLKIDKSFVDGISAGSSDLALCEAIIAMAHKLNLKVIAEGIETKDQYILLSGIDLDYCQGYLFSKPLPADQIEAQFFSRF